MYDAFVSYSHAADGRLAPQLQSGMQKFAKPWWRQRALHIFRDQTGLSANPHLWQSIETALSESRFLILLASPQAARSEWVHKELDWWLTNRSPNNLLVAVTEGEWHWDAATRRMQLGDNSAVPPRLQAAFDSEPRHIDLTWVQSESHVDARDGRFKDAIADLAAPLHGKAKDELYGEEIRQHQRTRRTAWAAASLLAALTVAAISAGILATNQRNLARSQKSVAEFQSKVATARGIAAYAVAQAPIRIDRALLLGAEAALRRPAPETGFGLFAALDAAAGLQGFSKQFGEDVVAFSLSPDRLELAVLKKTSRLQRWSTSKWRLLKETQLALQGPYGVVYRSNGRRLAAIGESGLNVLDSKSLDSISPLLAKIDDKDAFMLADINYDATRAAVTTYLGNSVTIESAATATAQTKWAVRDCKGGINGISWLPNNRHVGIGCANGLHLYDAHSGRLLGRDSSNAAAMGPLASPDGKILVVMPQNNELNVLRSRDLRPAVPSIKAPGGRVYSAAFVRNSRFLALGTDSGAAVIWDLQYHREIARLANMEDGVFGIEWLADAIDYSPAAGLTGNGRLLLIYEGRIAEWNLTQPVLIAKAHTVSTVEPLSPAADRPIDTVANRFLRMTGDGALLAEDLVTRNASLLTRLSSVNVESLTVSPSGNKIFLITDDIGPQVIDMQDPSLRRGLRTPPPLWAAMQERFRVRAGRNEPGQFAARFSPDEKQVALVGGGHAVVWALSDGAALATASVDQRIRHVAWSADATRLATTRFDGQISLFDSRNLQPIKKIEFAIDATIKDLYLAPQLGAIVVTSEGGSVGLLNANKMEIAAQTYTSGGSQLQSSAVSPDGKLLAAWSSDGAVRVWDVESATAIAPPLRGHPSGRHPNRIWFDPQGRLWSYTPGLLIEWDLDMRRAAKRACEIAGRQLTEVEWRQFVGDIPYQPSCSAN